MSYLLQEKIKKNKEDIFESVQKIIHFVDDVKKIDTKNINNTNKRKNVLRADVITVPSGTFKEKMLALAPKKYKDWFLSKKVL